MSGEGNVFAPSPPLRRLVEPERLVLMGVPLPASFKKKETHRSKSAHIPLLLPLWDIWGHNVYGSGPVRAGQKIISGCNLFWVGTCLL